eukprot:GFYU01005046.1.p1 GENE.GFYU01005046.1~~GFYU01005046.1.p1  ORF type:complete len:200 (-),score=62.18 GFYU01005046.1:28-627(-)
MSFEPKGKCNKTAVNVGSRKKIQYNWEDGSEMVEEYDLRSGELLLRKNRAKTFLGGEGEWNYEVGEPPALNRVLSDGIAVSSQNPVFTRKDQPDAFQWRIRNLPYPKDVYDVSVDEEGRRVVIKTSNKKYYKRIEIPDMDRLSLPFSANACKWSHANNTLIVSYMKPAEVMRAEMEKKQEVASVKASSQKDGDVECNQQ